MINLSKFLLGRLHVLNVRVKPLMKLLQESNMQLNYQLSIKLQRVANLQMR